MHVSWSNRIAAVPKAVRGTLPQQIYIAQVWKLTRSDPPNSWLEPQQLLCYLLLLDCGSLGTRGCDASVKARRCPLEFCLPSEPM